MTSISQIGVVGILPYESRSDRELGSIPLSTLSWPGQCVPEGDTIADLNYLDCVVVFPSSTRVLSFWPGLKCKVALLLTEPKAVHQKYYSLIWLLRFKFDLILCRYTDICQTYNNVVHFQPAEYWVKPEQVEACVEKDLACSLIASAKNKLAGHKLRHQLVTWVKDEGIECDVLGRGYRPFKDKADGLLPYSYSVVIENIEEPHYFSEKLLDTFICGTVPIYWGATNISDYFDPAGMVICNDLADLKNALQRMQIPYSDMMKNAMVVNKDRALSYASLEQRLVNVVRSSSS